MRDFRLEKAGEVAGEWRPGSFPEWHTNKGELFFLATWSDAKSRYGWFGVYHESLTHLDELSRDFAADILSWCEAPNTWPRLVDLWKQTPGWGLVCATNNRCRLWRDPIGRLPIFWMKRNDGIEWSTRPSFMQGFSPAIRRSRVKKFLACTNDRNRDDFWQGCSRIAAGETLVKTRRNDTQIAQWWPLNTEPLEPGKRIVSRVGALLTDSIRSTIPSGRCLVSFSGGVDSTLILALVVEDTASEVQTFSMVDPSTKWLDLRENLQQIQALLGVSGQYFDLRGVYRWKCPKIHHPIADFGPAWLSQAAYVTSYLDMVFGYQKADDEPPVLLSGHGADRLFDCRYKTYSEAQAATIASWGENLRRREWKQLVKKSFLLSGCHRLPGRIGTHPPWLQDYAERMGSGFQWRDLYREGDWFQRRRNCFRSWSWEHSMRLVERYRRTTGVLQRFPFVNPRLAELALRLQPSMLRNAEHSKLPLRFLLKRRVPRNIAFQNRFGGFDEVMWRGILKYMSPPPTELIRRIRESTVFQTVSSETLVKHLEVLKGHSDGPVKPYGHQFWRALAAGLWLNAWQMRH